MTLRKFACSLFLTALLCTPFAGLHALTDDPNGAEKPPSGRPWTPLEHLAFDPKVTSLPAGYSKGQVTAKAPFYGHRFIDDVGGSGWGWIKSGPGGWTSSAIWACLKETPGVCISPSRTFTKSDGDLNYEYEFWGYWAKYKAYDPRTDERLPVFVLTGWRVIGLKDPLDLKVGTPERVSRRTGPSPSTRNNPPGVD